MKKFLSLLFSLVLIAALGVTAMAETTYSITVDQDSTGHTYEVYQIFVGDLTVDENGNSILTNINWGNGITDAGKTYFGDAQTKADSLETAADSEAFASELNAYLSSNATTIVYDETDGYSASGLAAGYYLIKDSDGSLDGTTEGYTSYILKVVGDVTVEPKDSTTTFEKKIDDINDSTDEGSEIEWQDSADHDIGDAIDFKLEAVIAADYAAYETYYLAFHDVEENGLTFDSTSVKVYVDNTLVTEGYEVKTSPEDGCTFEVIFADLKSTSAKAGSTVTVLYQSVLNEDAVLGAMGNVNKAYAEFSNNPNDSQDGKGKTEWDYVIAFTYETVVSKKDENNQPLSGATFTLEKFVANENGTETYNDVKGNWKALGTVESEPADVFTFTGLDDGVYRLTETEAPEYYNAIDPIYFSVSAEHDVEWLVQERDDVLTSFSGNVATGEIQFTADTASGTLSTDVINKKGAQLPETGGIGTTIFYIVGGILVVGAVVVLVSKKRMNAEK